MKRTALFTILALGFVSAASAQGQASSIPGTSPDPFNVAVDQERQSHTAGRTANRSQNNLAEEQDQALQTLMSVGQQRYQRNDGVFILRFSEKAKEKDNIESDLGVMSHLLRKTVSEKFGSAHNTRNVLGVSVLTGPVGQPFRTAYIEGYGALFLLNAPFPLYPPPAKKQTTRKSPTPTPHGKKPNANTSVNPQNTRAVKK